MEYAKISSHVTLIQGMAINSKSNYLVSNEETSLRLLRIADMQTDEYKISMKLETPKRFISNLSDLIYSRTGQVGLVFRNKVGVVHNNCFRIEIIDDKLDKGFLYWYLKTKSIYNFVNSIAAGSAQPDLPHGSFKKIKFPIFNLHIQKKIAMLLDLYEKIIENNSKRIKLLEQAMDSIYKEWFVRFRFPGYENCKFVNGIPEGWNIKKISEICQLYRGKSYSSSDITSGDMALLSMNNIRPYGGFIRDFSRVYNGKYSDYQEVKSGDLIMSITDMTQERRVIGYVGLVTDYEKKMIICTHLLKIVSNLYENEYLYSLFTYSNLSREISARATGTNVLGLTSNIVNKVKTLIPPKNMIDEYLKIVKPIFKKIEKLIMKNENLIKQRDLLLPRLMSGKLEVK